METKTWYNLPPAYGRKLPPGPWDEEPDKMQWPDPDTGLACMIRRGPMGVWCGYVGVDETHPFYGQDYETPDVEVHGGLTFAAPCDGNEEEGICHVPGPGEPETLWWFGFDCGHFMDLTPSMAADDELFSQSAFGPELVYRDVTYVRAETTRLAAQLVDPRRQATV